MNSFSIPFTSKIHTNSERCKITHHSIAHDELYNISLALKSIRNSLGSEAEEEYWQQTLGPIRRLVFAACSTPLPFTTIAAVYGIAWEKLHQHVQLCRHLYPDLYFPLSELVQNLKNLGGDSPFLAPLESLSKDDARVSVLIYISRMNQAVETCFMKSDTLQGLEIVSIRQLREYHVCDRLVTIGPCKWLPGYIFLSPHAQEIHVINFSWLQDHWKPLPVFLSDPRSVEDKAVSYCIGRLPEIVNKSAANLHNQGASSLQPLDLLPPTQTFRKEMLHNVGWQPSHNEESARARFCHLAGERAVFVSAEEETVQLVIDISNNSQSIIRRVLLGALEPGMYLLLRTAGGGDFLIPLADRILGSIAEKRRKQQAEWKGQFISTAKKQFGELSRGALASAVSSYLCSNEILKASPSNVLYWMSSRSIRPRKKEDFIAVLRYAGIQDRAQELWDAMEDVGRAHRRAGHTIRKMLLQRISATSLEPLKRDGEMTFDLGEQDGGALSAFQIISISDEEFDIPTNLIGTLLDFGV